MCTQGPCPKGPSIQIVNTLGPNGFLYCVFAAEPWSKRHVWIGVCFGGMFWGMFRSMSRGMFSGYVS